MTQEDKDLLLKDLCARLPYKVKAFESDFEPPFVIASYDAENDFIDTNGWSHRMDSFKPYLRPMSSMSEEEKLQLVHYACIGEDMNGEFIDEVQRKDCHKYIDWLNKNHFDYRGLIEKGVALKAPESMYKL